MNGELIGGHTRVNPVHNVKRHAASRRRRSATYRALSVLGSSFEGTGRDQR